MEEKNFSIVSNSVILTKRKNFARKKVEKNKKKAIFREKEEYFWKIMIKKGGKSRFWGGSLLTGLQNLLG